MKITNIETFPIQGIWLFVVVDTDEGISGVGESGLGDHDLAVRGMIEHFKPWLIGQDANRIEYIWQNLFRGRFFPAGPIASSALSAIDIALWDIQGKALGVPVYQLLGGRMRDKVVCYSSVEMPGYDTAGLVESCLQKIGKGWKNVRWKLPDVNDVIDTRKSVLVSIKQVEAVRKAIGEEIGICFDVHTRLDLADSILLCRELEPFHPFFVEDPLRAEHTHSYAELRRHTSVPLAAGEQFASKWQIRELIEDDLIDYVRADMCIIGGISETRKIAGWAETHYIRMAPHNPLGPASTAACLHLDLAIDNFGIQEQVDIPGTSMTDIFPVQVPWKDGYLLPPTGPGLGIEFDREAARKYPFIMPAANVMLRRPDGSPANQ